MEEVKRMIAQYGSNSSGKPYFQEFKEDIKKLLHEAKEEDEKAIDGGNKAQNLAIID